MKLRLGIMIPRNIRRFYCMIRYLTVGNVRSTCSFLYSGNSIFQFHGLDSRSLSPIHMDPSMVFSNPRIRCCDPGEWPCRFLPRFNGYPLPIIIGPQAGRRLPHVLGWQHHRLYLAVAAGRVLQQVAIPPRVPLPGILT